MSTKALDERRNWRRERISLSLNVMLLRTGMRSLGCRLLDIGQGGAAIAVPRASSELIENGYTPQIDPGDEIDMLCSIETDSGRKSFHFPARVVHIQGDIIGVAFSEGHPPIDDFLRSYFSSRLAQRQDEPLSRSIADELLPGYRSREEEPALPASASPANPARVDHLGAKPSSAEQRSPFFGHFNVFLVAVMLAALAGYIVYMQRELSSLRAAFLPVSEQVSEITERLRQMDNNSASIRQIDDRLGRLSTAVTESQDQLAKLSVATTAEKAAAPSDPAPSVPLPPPSGEPMADALRQLSSAPRRFRLIADSVNVRQEPGGEFPIIGKLDEGARLSVIAVDGGWAKIETPDQRIGWISSEYIVADEEPISDVAETQPALVTTSPTQGMESSNITNNAEPAVGNAGDVPREQTAESNPRPRLVKISADSVNVRENPGTEFPVSFSLNQGDQVSVIGMQGVWLQIEDPDRGVGWVSSTYTRPQE